MALITAAGTSYTFPTKTTTAALVVLVGLAAEMGVASMRVGADTYGKITHELTALVPGAIEQYLQRADDVVAAAPLLRDRRQLIFVGSGACRAAALIGAAKICETCRRPALAINAEEYLHLIGFAVDRRDTVIVLAPGPVTDREHQVAEYALHQGAHVIVVAGAQDATVWPAAGVRLNLPIDGLASWSRALVTMALMHRLAGQLSVLIGSNPDRPEDVDLAYVLKLLYTTPLQGWL
jgi:glucosamine 6-phosphate synthetase-like amidotransferase/phosphosugar isomerase protein